MSPLPNIPSNLVSNVPQVPSFTTETQTLQENLSTADRIKVGALNTTFPPESFNLPNTGSSFEEVDTRINTIVDTFINAIPVPPVVPSVPGLGNLPKVNLPSPAEIRQFISQRIEQAKRRRQEATISAQLVAAQEEETPFTARQTTQNNVPAAEKVCIATEQGTTLDIAQKKAEFKLRRVLKCSGQQQIVDVRQENGVFIVTVKID